MAEYDEDTDPWYDEDTLRRWVPELEDEVVALRGALQALVDATATVIDDYDTDESGASFWQKIETMAAARAVAVAALTGQEPT